jgi:hypothetical protein
MQEEQGTTFGRDSRGLAGGNGEKKETRNWIATFSIGIDVWAANTNEATSMAMGFTKNEGPESCFWILKNEPLGLDEVEGLLMLMAGKWGVSSRV